MEGSDQWEWEGVGGSVPTSHLSSEACLSSVGPRSANCQHCGASTLALVFSFREFFFILRNLSLARLWHRYNSRAKTLIRKIVPRARREERRRTNFGVGYMTWRAVDFREIPSSHRSVAFASCTDVISAINKATTREGWCPNGFVGEAGSHDVSENRNHVLESRNNKIESVNCPRFRAHLVSRMCIRSRLWTFAWFVTQ